MYSFGVCRCCFRFSWVCIGGKKNIFYAVIMVDDVSIIRMAQSVVFGLSSGVNGCDRVSIRCIKLK